MLVDGTAGAKILELRKAATSYRLDSWCAEIFLTSSNQIAVIHQKNCYAYHG